MLLDIQNPHNRDGLLVFDEKEHKYSMGLFKFMSVTTFISTILFNPFDEDKISTLIVQKEKKEGDKYYGMNEIQIKNLWQEIRDLGTEFHKIIENYYNNSPNPNLSKFEKQFSLFNQFEKDVVSKKKLIPYRAEWRIFNRELKLAGTIDMVYKTPWNTFIIYDWKTSEKIKEYNEYESGIVHGVTDTTPDCNFAHYSIQLMLYKYILEKDYNIKVEKMFLLKLHSSQSTYIREEVINYPSFINKIVEYRLKHK
jgi:hypothetical protein